VTNAIAKFLLAASTALTIGLSAASFVHAQQKVTGGTLGAADYIEIQQLVARYGYAVDTHADNGYAYADLFTATGRSVRRKGVRHWRSLHETHRKREAVRRIRATTSRTSLSNP
jgi:hypothetical protein